MREIKFRGKRLDNGEWVDGFVLFNQDKSEAVIAKLTDTEAVCENVALDTIGQFTGLHDKNGKEIYEGDVITQYWGSPHYRNGEYYECNARRGQVLFDKSGCFVLLSESLLYHLFGDGLTQEVQGNIHDNPELLITEQLWQH